MFVKHSYRCDIISAVSSNEHVLQKRIFIVGENITILVNEYSLNILLLETKHQSVFVSVLQVTEAFMTNVNLSAVGYYRYERLFFRYSLTILVRIGLTTPHHPPLLTLTPIATHEYITCSKQILATDHRGIAKILPFANSCIR